MAIHVYMSQEPVLLRESGPQADDLFNYRGEAGPADDPASFVRLMAKRGHDVLLRETGEPPAITSPTGRITVDHWRGIPRRNLETQ